MSTGTATWIAEYERLLDACLEAERAGDTDTASRGLELLLNLLRRIDQGIEVVFFAEEAGSWQVGVTWRVVLPAWFRRLAPSAGPDDYAERVVDAINDFARHKADAVLAAARAIARPEQRAAMAEYEHHLRRGR